MFKKNKIQIFLSDFVANDLLYLFVCIFIEIDWMSGNWTGIMYIQFNYVYSFNICNILVRQLI